MTYETKMARVRALIEAFNASAKDKIDVAAFEAKLKALGACDDKTLAHVSWEDLQECGLPRLLVRQVAEELRGKPEGSDFISQKKVDRMRYEELIERYNPREDDAVAKKLRELSGDKRFIVFRAASNAGGAVDQIATLRLLLELRRHLGEVPLSTDSSGLPAKTYKIGEVPNDELDENPIYAGRVLRTDDTCDQTLRSWKGIPLAVRQLVYLALNRTHEAKVASLGDAHDILDRCLEASKSATGMEALHRRYPRADVLFAELSDKGELPRLKVRVGERAGNHPFHQPVAVED